MALSGSVSTGVWTSSETSNTWKVVLNWTAKQDINNNTSTVSWNLKVSSTSSSYVVISELRVKFAGEEIFYRNQSNHTNGYDGTTLASGTKVITHNEDGTKSFNVSVEAGIWEWAINKSGSGTIKLDDIQRSSSITYAGNVTLGKSCNIKWTPATVNYKYKLTFAIGDWNYTTDYISPSITSEYTYDKYIISGDTISNNTTIYEQLKNATSGIMTVTLTTYNSSGTIIGSSSSKTFKVSISSSDQPSIESILIEPVDGDILVKGKNKIKISVSGCKASPGSTIKSYSFYGPNVSSTINSSSDSVMFTSDTVISTAGELTYTVKLTDSRGKTVEMSGVITCHEYGSPSFSSFRVYRCDQNGNIKENGEYIKYSFNIKYASVDNNNATIEIYYKSNSDNDWTSAANAATNETKTDFDDFIKNSSGNKISFNSDTTYLVRAVIIDSYNTSVKSSIYTVFGGSRTVNIRKGGLGIAFGKMADYDSVFEVKWPARFISTAGAKPDSQANVAIRVGDAGGQHLDIYSRGIMAKGNPSSTDDLYLSGKRVYANVDTTTVFRVEKDTSGKYVMVAPTTYNVTNTNAPNIYMTSGGTFTRSTSSSKRYKTDIKDVQDESLNPYGVLNIPVRQFKYNEDNIPVNRDSDDLYIGFIAEEVEKAYPIAAEYNEDGQVEMWNIKFIVPAMLKIIQDQQKEINNLKMAVDELKSTNK